MNIIFHLQNASKKVLTTYAEEVISEAGFKVKAETFQSETLGWTKKEKKLSVHAHEGSATGMEKEAGAAGASVAG